MTGLDVDNFRVNLLSLVPGMKRVASTNGGEYAGPCPFCGGQDRFRIQPESNRWYCRQCGDGKWHDVIDFVMRRDGCNFQEAARKLNVPMQVNFLAAQKKTFSQYQAPDDGWQAMARQVIDRCQSNLFSKNGDPGLEYLLSRGLTSQTMEKYHLGYSPSFWVGKVKIQQGITIPAINNGKCWYIKIRSLPNAEWPRYLCVSGSKTNAVFGGDDVIGKSYTVISEGEFNAMILDQEVGHVMPICSLGSASNKLDVLTWGRYFLAQKYVMCLFDSDPAGEKGYLNMKDFLGDRARRLPMPGNGDINDFYIAGGDIWAWLEPQWEVIDGTEK